MPCKNLKQVYILSFSNTIKFPCKLRTVWLLCKRSMAQQPKCCMSYFVTVLVFPLELEWKLIVLSPESRVSGFTPMSSPTDGLSRGGCRWIRTPRRQSFYWQQEGFPGSFSSPSQFGTGPQLSALVGKASMSGCECSCHYPGIHAHIHFHEIKQPGPRLPGC